MKKILSGCAIALLFVMPAKAQYLFDEKSLEKETEKVNSSQSASFFSGYERNTGYRGFVDVESFFDAGGVGIGINTTHGFQILSDFFIGAGVGVEYVTTDSADGIIIPLYADIRGDLNIFGNSRFSLFGDLKIGAVIGEEAGFMLDPMIGLRIGLSERLGLNIGLGCYAISLDGEFGASPAVKVGIDF